MTAIEPMDPTDVEAEIARIEARARRRMWWWLPLLALAGGAGGLAAGMLVDTTHHHRHGGQHHPVVGYVVAAVVVLVVVVALVLVRRRRGRLWSRAPLGFGLTREQRRAVKQDLRHGTPNADPVLAEVERRTAARVTRQSRWNKLASPLVVVVLAVNIVLPDRTVFGRIYFAVFLVAVVAVWPYQVRNLRRLRAFPGPSASDDGGGVHG